MKESLTDFLSTEDIANLFIEDLVSFLVDKSKNRFTNPETKKAARYSYRLDKTLANPLNAPIAASFNCIKALEKEVKILDKAIEKAVKTLNIHEFELKALVLFLLQTLSLKLVILLNLIIKLL